MTSSPSDLTTADNSLPPVDTTPPEAVPRGRRFRRWMTHLVIVAYLGWLGHGVVCHALHYKVNSHPIMYFTVWDMFCGWSGWSFRTHVVAQGDSGQMYELTPSPWGQYAPFSDIDRVHYDTFGNHARLIGVNALKQTDHEPMQRIFVVEECWSKKFNLPEPLWDQLHEEPADPQHYFHVRSVYTPEGQQIAKKGTFLDQQITNWLTASLRGQSGRNRSYVIPPSPLSN